MSATDELIAHANSYVGYLEKASNSNLDSFTANAGSNNYTRFARDYCSYFGESINVYQGQPWCAMFVSVMFADMFGADKAEEMIYGHYAYCPYGVQHFKNNGAWHTSPKAGDVIFFASSGTASHTGIVRKVSGGRVYTVEGNTSSASGVVANGGAVAQKSYSTGYSRILGYGRPNWSIAEESNGYDKFLKKLVNKGVITDTALWSDYAAPVKKCNALALIDKCSGGTWASEEANEAVHWSQKHVYSLCGKGVINSKSVWLVNPEASISAAQTLALAAKIVNNGGTELQQYETLPNDHWGRNYLNFLCDKAIINTPTEWTDFEGEVSTGNFIALICKAFGF